MTATSVKGVGNVMNPGAVPAAAKAVDESFQAVWNSRVDSKAQKPAETSGQKAPRKDVSADAESDSRPTRDAMSEKRVSGAETAKQKTDVSAQDELSGEELEKVMAVLATAAMDLVQQIADTFQIPVGDVQDIMAQMDLQPADLLNAADLSSLLLEAGGAEDSLALLTNEQLYTDFQTVMEQGRQILKDSAESLEMTPEQFLQTVQETPADPEQAVKEPVIEVSVMPEEEAQAEEPKQFEQKDAVSQTEGLAELFREVPTGVKETANEQGASKRQDKDASDGQHAGNPFLTEARSEQFRPEMQEVQETSGTWDADTQNIMRQIMDYMRIQVRPNISSLELQLHPASLGTLQVQVASKGGVLTANFVTQNETVKAALESQMVQLKESFAQQGVKVEAIEVTVQTHQFDQNLEQGRGRQPQGSADKKGRSRRGGLSGVQGADAPEEISGEQQTAQRTEVSGSTVDYTA